MNDAPRKPSPGEPPGHPQDRPFVVTCAPGKYALCRCRRSARFPWCDGTHRTTPVGEVEQTPVKVVIDVEREVAWCCCGRSAKHPFCDGSHARG